MFFESNFDRSTESSTALKASSRFLKRCNVPNPFILTRASRPVLRLTSIRTAKISTRIRFTYSWVAFVTRDSEAKDKMASSALGTLYSNFANRKTVTTSTYRKFLMIRFSVLLG